MTTIRFAALAFAASLLSTPALAQESPVLGTWNTQAVTDFGTFASTMTVLDDEGSYIVTLEDVAPAGGGAAPPAMESSISDVVVDGATFTFKRSLTTPQGAMELAYAGTVDGNNLTATVTSPMGAIPVTGTRAAE
jgi:hypothetical protein